MSARKPIEDHDRAPVSGCASRSRTTATTVSKSQAARIENGLDPKTELALSLDRRAQHVTRGDMRDGALLR